MRESSLKNPKKEDERSIGRKDMAWSPSGDVIWDEDEVFLFLQSTYWDFINWPLHFNKYPSNNNHYPFLPQFLSQILSNLFPNSSSSSFLNIQNNPLSVLIFYVIFGVIILFIVKWIFKKWFVFKDKKWKL